MSINGIVMCRKSRSFKSNFVYVSSILEDSMLIAVHMTSLYTPKNGHCFNFCRRTGGMIHIWVSIYAEEVFFLTRGWLGLKTSMQFFTLRNPPDPEFQVDYLATELLHL